MALTDQQKEALRAAAEREGVSYEELLAAADGEAGGETEGSASGKPLFERMLIGAFPYVRVRELRKHWLGLDESLPDDELTCLEHELKTRQRYGGGAAPGASPTEEE